MPSSPRHSFYLIVLWIAGIHSSTLRLHPEQRFMLPQYRGYFTIDANEDLTDADGGGGAAAAAMLLAAHGRTKGGSDSGVLPQHRSRRSSGDSTMPKVYGQVTSCRLSLHRASVETSCMTFNCHLLEAIIARLMLLFEVPSFHATLCSRVVVCCHCHEKMKNTPPHPTPPRMG